jgi:5'-3' exonuclease
MTETYHPQQIEQAMCNSYTALARDCTDNYIDVDWRTPSLCRMLLNEIFLIISFFLF